MDIAELDINAVCFGILCNFPQFCGEERAKEAAELVHALYAERETLRADLARVTAERDGAVKDLKKWNICATCGHYSPYGKKSNCKTKSAHISGGNWAGCSEWEWRGIKED